MQQGTQEWLDFRKKKIGASEASIVLGINPWKTAHRLWLEKMGYEKPDPPNKSMLDGLRLEPIARKYFEDKTGFSAAATIRTHPEYDWMIASLDGINEKEEFILEIKCGGEMLHGLAMSKQIPDYYYCQLQHQLAVTGYRTAYYESYMEKFNPLTLEKEVESVIMPFDRNNDFIENTLIPQLKQFWNYIENKKEPPLSNRDYKKMDSEEWTKVSLEYSECCEQVEYYEALKEEAKNKLIKMANGFNCTSPWVKICKTYRKGNVDYLSIPELKDVDVEPYRKPGVEFWSIRRV